MNPAKKISKMKSVLFVLLMLSTQSGIAQPVRKVRITELAAIVDSSTHPLVVNFWATWCMPCIEEIPSFRKLTSKYKKDSVELILVSLDMKDDYQQKIPAFVKKWKITNFVVWLDEHDADYFCPVVDPDWSGSIPATLLINRAKNHRRFFEQKLTEKKLEEEIRDML